jgi:hypothetical protein
MEIMKLNDVERVVRALQLLKEEVTKFPKGNVMDIDIFDALEKLRGRYKNLKALLQPHCSLPTYSDYAEESRQMTF